MEAGTGATFFRHRRGARELEAAPSYGSQATGLTKLPLPSVAVRPQLDLSPQQSQLINQAASQDIY
jgi:hypothetical protein